MTFTSAHNARNILRAPDDGGAGGVVQGAVGGPESQGDENARFVEKPTKPENVPDKFWDPAKNAVRVDDLLKSYGNAESELGKIVRGGKTADQYRTDVAKELKTELEASAAKDRPATAKDYKIALPDGLLPNGVNVDLSDSDPMLGFWRDFAHKSGMSNDKFNEAIAGYLQMQLASMPNYDTEKAKLGENADARIERGVKWAKSALSESTFGLFENLAATSEGITALEEIMKLAGEPDLKAEGGDSNIRHTAPADKSMLKTKMQDPRYWNQRLRDPAFVKEVDDGFARLFPGKTRVGETAPSSQRS